MTQNRSEMKPFRPRLQAMIDQLRDDIVVHGKYAPGQFLPSELALVKQFQLSNKTVRKGLEQLTEEGLITKIPRVGSVVTASAQPVHATVVLGTMGSLERDMKLSLLLKEFARLHPGIRVETVHFHSAGFAELAQTYLRTGLMDVCMLNDEQFWHLANIADKRTLEPLEPAPSLYPFLYDLFSIDGIPYVQPVIFSPVVLAYNKAHFRETGVPEPDASWTWEETLTHARKLTVSTQRYGLCFYPLSNNRWPVFLLQQGSGFKLGPDGNYALEQSSMLDHIRFTRTLLRNREMFPDFWAESSRDFADLFARGQSSMMITTYMAANEWAGTDLEYDLSPVPYTGHPYTLLTSIGVAMNPQSRNKAAAKRLVDFFISPTAQQLIRQHTVSIPASKQAAEAVATQEEDQLNRPNRFHLYRNIVPGFRRHRDLHIAPSAYDKLRELLKRYWADLIDEETLCEQVNALVMEQAADSGRNAGGTGVKFER